MSQVVFNRQSVNAILKVLMQKFESSIKTTPGRIKFALGASILAAVLMTAVVYNAYYDVRSTVQTVGKDTVPSIVAAENIRTLISEAHANAMNGLISSNMTSAQTWKVFRDNMNDAHDMIITAAQNITYGDQERVPIYTMDYNLAQYETLIGQAREDSGYDKLLNLSVANYMMHKTILPASVALDQANYSHLDEIYTAHRNHILLIMISVWLFVILIGAILGLTQLYLYRKTHRLLNKGFVAASIILVILFGYTNVTLKSVEDTLVSAKQDAFDSVHALWQARAVAYDSNVDESLYLTYFNNPVELRKAEDDYTSKIKLLTDITPSEAIQRTAGSQKFSGYIGDELANVTFPGERQAAVTTLNTWAAYVSIDNQIRSLLSQGDYQGALALDIGNNKGQSNWAFDQFDTAISSVIDINQKQFDQKVSDAFGELDLFPYILLGALVLIIGACVIGLRPRLEEYHY